jgi:hypothetical protein
VPAAAGRGCASCSYRERRWQGDVTGRSAAGCCMQLREECSRGKDAAAGRREKKKSRGKIKRG